MAFYATLHNDICKNVCNTQQCKSNGMCNEKCSFDCKDMCRVYKQWFIQWDIHLICNDI